jgi:hypothetical protein
MNFGKHVMMMGAAAMVVLGGGGAALASSSTVAHRPQVSAKAATSTSSTLTPLVQEFSTSTSPFCPANSGNAPCDGVGTDFGTITSTAYTKDGIPALAAGEPDYALTAGSNTTASGCPNTSTSEYCTGPYALFDGGQLATFPAQGFTVTTDLYLTPSEPGDITADVGLNNNDGAYGNDIFINFCPVTGGGLAVSAGTMESCNGATAANITTAGWYRLVWAFTPDAGNVALDQSVTSEATGYAVWQGELDAPVTVNGVPATTSNTGGPTYFWLPTENTNSLPLSNFVVQLGSHPGGSAPDTVTVSPVRRTTSGTGRVKLPVTAKSLDGLPVSYSVSGAPGLRVSHGYLRGHVAKGRYNVTVTATDAAGVTGRTSFRLIAKR